ncbi:hypothetical protein BH708_16085 [Brachybacterium sp. P6-10-X1]|uniref:MurR/RpiR family transcriptional regulator n=1 Tax=Brachybacterium sp. P6-10-X1 TaxID=1903186 RepID=UPI000971B574|nr:MurR/RpiR family transcriptional regulator [Brachybacterium sp. P6-10-X1]APX33976.1 hypothetical protein BH708_16085 [Brachybacterium sp. P6-10-X1]
MWPVDAPELTRQEEAIARFALEVPLAFATSSGAAIAARTDTSEASVARAAKKLGFENVREMKSFCASRVQETANLQSVLSGRLDALDTDDATRSTSGLTGRETVTSGLRSAAKLVLAVEQSVEWPSVEAAAADIGGGPRVILYGLGTGYSLAQYAEIEFSRLGLDARATTGGGHANAQAAFQITAEDVVLVVAPRAIFPDIERFLAAVLRTTKRVYVITQASLPAPLSSAGASALRLPPSGGSGATDAVGTIALIDSLVADIARRHPRRALEARTRAQAYRDEFSR